MKGERGEAIVKAMLRCGKSPNDQTPDGHLLLHLSIKASSDEVVKILIAAGAEIDIKDRNGLTPFQVAVLQENKLLADFILSKGARKQPLPGSGFTKYCRLYPD